MSLTNVLRGALNVCKMRPLAAISRFPAMSSIASPSIYKITADRKNLCDIKKVHVSMPSAKITEMVSRQFSTTTPVMSSGGDHSKLWVLERYVSAALLGILPLGLMWPNMLFDLLMAASVVMHMHWGIEAIVIDYIRPIIFGNFIPKIAVMLVYLLSIFTMVGLLNLTFNNVGLGNSVRLLWRA